MPKIKPGSAIQDQPRPQQGLPGERGVQSLAPGSCCFSPPTEPFLGLSDFSFLQVWAELLLGCVLQLNSRPPQ